MRLLLVLIVSLVGCSRSTSGTIRPSSELSIINGQGFLAYLEAGKGFGNISHCWFNSQGQDRIEIELNSTETIKTGNGEEIRAFAKAICGIRVDNVSMASTGTWHLQAESLHEESIEGDIKINILAAPKTKFETKVTKPLGKTAISCTMQEYTKVCKLINPMTNDSWNQCNVYTTVYNGSSFECRTLSWGSMTESVETISVEAAPRTLYSEASMEETDEHYVLRCVMHSTSLYSCRAEMPDRITQLYIMDGLSNGRYTSYDTVSSQSRCSLEIPKPLEPNEHGLWKIQHSDASQLTGCLFYVGNQTKETIIDEELQRQQFGHNDNVNPIHDHNAKNHQRRRRRIELYSDSGTIPEISCAVPFVVNDCYLRDPWNNVKFPDSVKFERSRALGICTFINLECVSGIWSCGLRGSDYKGDIIQDIEVALESKLGRVLTDHIRTAQRDSLELMCKSPFGEPISKCVYVDPSNQVHLVATANGGNKTTGHVQYFGGGIGRGFCGMRIDDVTVDDFGAWSCQFQMYTSGQTVSNFTIIVTEKVLSYASSNGLLFGLLAIILAVLIGSFAFYFYKNRRRTISSTSDETIDTANGGTDLTYSECIMHP